MSPIKIWNLDRFNISTICFKFLKGHQLTIHSKCFSLLPTYIFCPSSLNCHATSTLVTLPSQNHLTISIFHPKFCIKVVYSLVSSYIILFLCFLYSFPSLFLTFFFEIFWYLLFLVFVKCRILVYSYFVSLKVKLMEGVVPCD